MGRKEIGALVGSGAVGLVCGLLVSALQVAGIISMNVAHGLVFAAWVISIIAVCASETLLAKSLKHTLVVMVVVAVAMGGGLLKLDRWMVAKKKEQDIAALRQQQVALPSPTPVISPSASPSPSPLRVAASSPSMSRSPRVIRVRPTSSPYTAPPGFTAKPVSAQLAIEGGKRQNVLEMMRTQENYKGPGSVLQFEVILINSEGLYAGDENVSDKRGLPIEESRYWQQVDISDLYFYMAKTGRVAVTFVWLRETKPHP